MSTSRYSEAKALVVEHQKASAALIQRILLVGFSEASRYLEMMEDEAICGRPNSSGVRQVLTSAPTQGGGPMSGAPSQPMGESDNHWLPRVASEIADIIEEGALRAIRPHETSDRILRHLQFRRLLVEADSRAAAGRAR